MEPLCPDWSGRVIQNAPNTNSAMIQIIVACFLLVADLLADLFLLYIGRL